MQIHLGRADLFGHDRVTKRRLVEVCADPIVILEGTLRESHLNLVVREELRQMSIELCNNLDAQRQGHVVGYV